jgi:uncharacterized protein
MTISHAPGTARPVAVVTGASTGIGAAFAEALASRGYDLLLVARNMSALEAVAARARERGVRAEAVVADLAEPGGAGHVVVAAESFGEVDLLINNAGFGFHGPFDAEPLENAVAMLRVNVESLVVLTRGLAPAMLARRRGAIVNVASTAAFQPVPWMAVYGATKAFVLSFSEALSEEFRDRRVRVLALCPGATATNFSAIAGESAQFGRRRRPEQVVATALRALDAGRSGVVVDGAANRLMSALPRVAPRGLVTRVAGRVMR